MPTKIRHSAPPIVAHQSNLGLYVNHGFDDIIVSA